MIVKIGGIPLPDAIAEALKHINPGFFQIVKVVTTTPILGNGILIILVGAVSAYWEYRLRQRNKPKQALAVKYISYFVGGFLFLDAFLDAGNIITYMLVGRR